jgi:hypothetical protein
METQPNVGCVQYAVQAAVPMSSRQTGTGASSQFSQ